MSLKRESRGGGENRPAVCKRSATPDVGSRPKKGDVFIRSGDGLASLRGESRIRSGIFCPTPWESLPLFPVRENGENKGFFHPLSARSILARSF